jgi:hypothetical protein
VWREATLARQIASGLLPEGTELSPRPEWVPAWDSLDADTRRLYARFMEAFAGFLSHTDNQIGRLVDHLAATGDLDNTLLFVLSDNGASSEGGPTGSVNDIRLWNLVPRSPAEALARIDEIGGPRMHNNYPWGWTVAGNTPFKRWKREVHEGGVADPLLVHWPRRVAATDAVRRQYVHAIDIVPTVLDVLGLEAPATIGGVEQRPIEGTSFAATFNDPAATDGHRTQYYEMFGCRALYDRGWKAVTYHPIQADEPGLDKVGWELYHVADDPSECHDLAAAEPERLAAMVDQWWNEAERYNVLPVDNRPFSDFVFEKPILIPERREYVYRPGAAMVPEPVAVNVRNRTHIITATVEVPEGGADGVLVAMGSLLGGFCLYLQDGRLRYFHTNSGLTSDSLVAPEPVPTGSHALGFRYTKTGEHEGDGALLVDGAVVAEGHIARFTPVRFSLHGGGLTCGYDGGLPVREDYGAPFPFTGRLEGVVVTVDGPPYVDPEGEAEVAVATQ